MPGGFCLVHACDGMLGLGRDPDQWGGVGIKMTAGKKSRVFVIYYFNHQAVFFSVGTSHK